MQALVACLFLILATAELGADVLVATRGSSIVVIDPNNGVTATRFIPQIPFVDRVIAQDILRNRIFVETIDTLSFPSYRTIWRIDLLSGEASSTKFHPAGLYNYFYDPDSDTLFFFPTLPPRYIGKVDLNSGATSSVLTVLDLGIINDDWQIAAYDPLLDRLYLFGGIETQGEFSRHRLFVADLHAGSLEPTEFTSWQTLRFVPYSEAGKVYAQVAQGLYSEVQHIIRIDVLAGTETTVVDSLPASLLLPTSYCPSDKRLYLRRFPDNQLFVADLASGTLASVPFTFDYRLEFAPFLVPSVPAVPTFNTGLKAALLEALAAVALIALRQSA